MQQPHPAEGWGRHTHYGRWPHPGGCNNHTLLIGRGRHIHQGWTHPSWCSSLTLLKGGDATPTMGDGRTQVDATTTPFDRVGLPHPSRVHTPFWMQQPHPALRVGLPHPQRVRENMWSMPSPILLLCLLVIKLGRGSDKDGPSSILDRTGVVLLLPPVAQVQSCTQANPSYPYVGGVGYTYQSPIYLCLCLS